MAPPNTSSRIQSSPILTGATLIATVAGWFTLQWHLHRWLGRRFTWCADLVDRVDIPEKDLEPDVVWRRARAIDWYVIAWLGIEIAVLFALTSTSGPIPRALAIVPAVSRTVDIVRATLKVAVLDRISRRKYDLVASGERLVVIALLSYFELILCFAIIYASSLSALLGAHGVVDVLLFSVLTQLTISFGAPTPHGWLRLAAASQGLCGLYFVAVVIARMVGGQRDVKALDD